MSEKPPLINRIRETAQKRPILSSFFGKRELKANELGEAQKQLAEEFRSGIAEALGVPPEAVKDKPVEQWVLNFTRAFVKPEYYKETTMPSLHQIRIFGMDLGAIVRNAIDYGEELARSEAQKNEQTTEQKKTDTPIRTRFKTFLSVDT